MSVSKEDYRVRAISKSVCEFYDCSLEDIFQKTRKREVVLKRQILHYLLCHHTKLSLHHIGSYFAKYGDTKDHSTVLHSKKTIQNLIDTDKQFKNEMTGLLKIVQSNVKIFRRENLTDEDLRFLNFRRRVIQACRRSPNEMILKNELIAIL